MDDHVYDAYYNSKTKEIVIGLTGEAVSSTVSVIGDFPWEEDRVFIKKSVDGVGFIIKQDAKRNILKLKEKNKKQIRFNTGEELLKILRRSQYSKIANIKSLEELDRVLWQQYQNVCERGPNAC